MRKNIGGKCVIIRRDMRGKTILCGAAFLILGIIAALTTTAARTPKTAAANLQTAPFANLDGTETIFADLPPARRLVNFWATWCAPCVHEMPLLQQAAQANSDVHFSGVAVDHADLVRQFIGDMKITYDIFTPKFDIFLLFEDVGNENGVLPYTLLLDEEGGIIARKIGEFHSLEEINSFLSENLT